MSSILPSLRRVICKKQNLRVSKELKSNVSKENTNGTARINEARRLLYDKTDQGMNRFEGDSVVVK